MQISGGLVLQVEEVVNQRGWGKKKISFPFGKSKKLWKVKWNI